MKLVRLGARVFNLDKLIEARINDAQTETLLLFAAPEGSMADSEAEVSPYFVRLNREETGAFVHWVAHNAEVLLEFPRPSAETLTLSEIVDRTEPWR